MSLMSIQGEEIINRLPLHSKLRNEDNPMRKILIYTIGEWLNQYNVDEWFKQHFLNDATGKYLDLFGKQFNVKRKIDEEDGDYRQRIIYIVIGHLTVPYLKSIYNVEIYNKPNNYVEDMTLLSDNEYYLQTSSNIDIEGYYGIADETTQNILNKKFILTGNGGVTWL